MDEWIFFKGWMDLKTGLSERLPAYVFNCLKKTDMPGPVLLQI